MKWQLVCARNTILAMLPFQTALRSMKRRLLGRTHRIDASSVYSGGFDHIHMLREAGLEIKGATILELGTGWYPVIPLMLRLAGARHVILTDEHRLLDEETLGAAVAFLSDRREDVASRLGVATDEVDRLLDLTDSASLDQALKSLGLSYRVPTRLDDDTLKVDAIVSHTVLEHIPPEILREIFEHSAHVLGPSRLVSHGTDHSDHRQHKDQTLSRLDFLRYNPLSWRMLCVNPQDYTNRLRYPDLLDMIKAAGLEVVTSRALVDEKSLDDLAGLKLSKSFQDYDRRDLATTWSHIVARSKPA